MFLGIHLKKNFTVGVFDGDQFVGVVNTSIYFALIDANLAFLVIYGNLPSAIYSVKVLVNNEIFESGSVEFIANGVLGSLDSPFVISPIYSTLGCTDSTSFNNDPIANVCDESCIAMIIGCMSDLYIKFNTQAKSGLQDFLCQKEIVFGCLDDYYIEFNPMVNTNNESCIYTCEQSYLSLIKNAKIRTLIIYLLVSHRVGLCLGIYAQFD